jgi:formiminotetrahydrofolate cyclodeaminase
MKLIDRTLRDLLAAFSAPDPTPGGGSASALAAAVGVSLLMMVAGLAKTRNGSDDDRAALATASSALASIRDELAAANRRRRRRYDRVVAAYKLPRGRPTSSRRGSRPFRLPASRDGCSAIGDAAVGPRMRRGGTIAAHGHRAAASDVGTAMTLLRAGLHGAGLNVEINLGSVSDPSYVEPRREEAARLAERASRASQEADAVLRA